MDFIAFTSTAMVTFTVLLVELCIIYQTLGDFTEGSTSPHDNNEVGSEYEYHYTAQLDYKHPQWCHTLKLQHGEVSCSSPHGGRHQSMLGTRCMLSCDRGYKLLGHSSLMCTANRRWSGTAVCRKVRCRVLPVIQHGMYSCSRGFLAESRCDYTCYEGFQIQNDPHRICQDDGHWSGTEPTCADHDPPKLKCPLSRTKIAEPGKLTARVSWERPTAKDTADRALQVMRHGPESGSDFSEGTHNIRYKVYDQARNTATCKFTVTVEGKKNCGNWHLHPPGGASVT